MLIVVDSVVRRSFGLVVNLKRFLYESWVMVIFLKFGVYIGFFLKYYVWEFYSILELVYRVVDLYFFWLVVERLSGIRSSE